MLVSHHVQHFFVGSQTPLHGWVVQLVRQCIWPMVVVDVRRWLITNGHVVQQVVKLLYRVRGLCCTTRFIPTTCSCSCSGVWLYKRVSLCYTATGQMNPSPIHRICHSLASLGVSTAFRRHTLVCRWLPVCEPSGCMLLRMQRLVESARLISLITRHCYCASTAQIAASASLLVTVSKHVSNGDRAFLVVATRTRNSLPACVTLSSTFQAQRQNPLEWWRLIADEYYCIDVWLESRHAHLTYK